MYAFVSHSFTVGKKAGEAPLERRFQAIGEELAGFFLRDVIPEFGEYHHSPYYASM